MHLVKQASQLKARDWSSSSSLGFTSSGEEVSSKILGRVVSIRLTTSSMVASHYSGFSDEPISTMKDLNEVIAA